MGLRDMFNRVKKGLQEDHPLNESPVREGRPTKPALKGTPEDLRKIERLYQEDREAEALMLIDEIIQLHGSFDEKLFWLKQIASDKEMFDLDIREAPEFGEKAFGLWANIGGELLETLFIHRSKCLAVVNFKTAGNLHSKAEEHVRLAHELFPESLPIQTISAQILARLGHTEQSLTMLQNIMAKHPGFEPARISYESIMKSTQGVNIKDMAINSADALFPLLDRIDVARSRNDTDLARRLDTLFIMHSDRLATYLRMVPDDKIILSILTPSLAGRSYWDLVASALQILSWNDTGFGDLRKVCGDKNTKALLAEATAKTGINLNTPAETPEDPKMAVEAFADRIKSWALDQAERLYPAWMNYVTQMGEQAGGFPALPGYLSDEDRQGMLYMADLCLKKAGQTRVKRLFLVGGVLRIAMGDKLDYRTFKAQLDTEPNNWIQENDERENLYLNMFDIISKSMKLT